MSWRIHLLAKRLIAVAMTLGLGMIGPAAAQPLLTDTASSQPASGETFSIATHEAWQVICEGDTSPSKCHLSAVGKVSGGQSKPVTLYLSSMRRSDGEQILILETPLDLLLSKGVEIRFDGSRPLTLGYRSCHASGCVAPFRLDDRMKRRFVKGSRLSVTVYDLQATPIEIEFSLIGFTAASSSLGS